MPTVTIHIYILRDIFFLHILFKNHFNSIIKKIIKDPLNLTRII